VLNNPDVNICLSLAADIVLEASISEVSKKIASAVDKSLSQQVLMSTMLTIRSYQRKVSTLQGCISNPTVSSSANNSSTSELDDDDQCEADDLAELRERSTLWNVEERKMGTREWRMRQRIFQGSVENGVIRIYVCPLILFINNST